MKTVSTAIGNLDFAFQHSTIRIVASSNCQEIKLAGLSIGPFEEGDEYESYYWVARGLEKTGIARLREDNKISAAKLSKLHWTERVQTAGQVSKLPESFYPMLRRCLSELREGTAKGPEKLIEYEKSRYLARDIVNSRLKKIVSMASAPDQTEQALKNFSREEKFLYDRLHGLISEWRTQILEYEGKTE